MKMSHLDPYTNIPEDLIIPAAKDLLYEIGLCPTSVSEEPKRRAVNHPIVTAFGNYMYLFERIASLMLDDNDHLYLMIVGEYARYSFVYQRLNSSKPISLKSSIEKTSIGLRLFRSSPHSLRLSGSRVEAGAQRNYILLYES